jgi:threonine/homoserine/homoserine lactone efflux protein
MTLPELPAGVIAGFVIASVLIELTPGPNMLYLTIVAATDGRRAGMATVAGVALGLGLVGVAAAYGLAAAITAVPLLRWALRWGGVAFLLWLAWDGWRAAGMGEAGPMTPAAPLLSRFRRGLVANLLNPKAALFYIAVLPGFVVPGGPVMPQVLFLTALYVAIATAIHAAIVAMAGSFRRWLEDPVREGRLRRILSAGLALVALWFAWETRA